MLLQLHCAQLSSNLPLAGFCPRSGLSDGTLHHTFPKPISALDRESGVSPELTFHKQVPVLRKQGPLQSSLMSSY